MALVDQPTAPIRTLQALGLPFRVHEHPPARTFDELHLTGLDVETSAKTLAFVLADGSLALAAIPGPARLRYAQLAAALGVSRSSLRAAGPDDLAPLDMTPGGVSPVTDIPGVRLVLDASLIDLPVLYCGGGRPELTIEITPRTLLDAMPSAILANLCDSPSLA
jgi:Cys-tRNA(Pro)/Cys-tRNA(Cys) deacylase